MAYKVIGTYDDGTDLELDTFDTIHRARSAIRWQAQPRGDMKWLDDEKTRAEVRTTGGRHNYTVIWRIEET